jgi:hypothetical protein
LHSGKNSIHNEQDGDDSLVVEYFCYSKKNKRTTRKIIEMKNSPSKQTRNIDRRCRNYHFHHQDQHIDEKFFVLLASFRLASHFYLFVNGKNVEDRKTTTM